MNRKCVLGTLVALASAISAFAIPPGPCEQPKDVCCEKPAPGPFAFSYAQDLGLSCPNNFYVGADFLLMQAQEEGLEYAIGNLNGDSHFPLRGGNIEGYSNNHHDWDWNLGFRANMGFYLNHDGWNIDLAWTHLRIRNDKGSSFHGQTGAFVPFWMPADTEVQDSNDGCSQRWKTRINTLDVKLGKPHHVSRHFVCNPFIGLRAAWIDQDLLARYFGAFDLSTEQVDAEMTASNNFCGLGARAGFDTKWKLAAGWSILGKLSGSLLYGKFDVTQQLPMQAVDGDSLAYEIDNDFYAISPNMEMGLGIEWSYKFSKDRYLWTIRAMYEFHDWFKQNRLRRFLDSNNGSSSGSVAASVPMDGDLSLSGFSFTMQFDF